MMVANEWCEENKVSGPVVSAIGTRVGMLVLISSSFVSSGTPVHENDAKPS